MLIGWINPRTEQQFILSVCHNCGRPRLLTYESYIVRKCQIKKNKNLKCNHCKNYKD